MTIPTHQNAIVVDTITKRFGDFTAVDDLSFEVRFGEIFSMLGHNGAGKTTTIRMILDILKPDRGAISVLGGAITPQTKDQIGYLPEERGLYRNVRVIDILVYLGQLKGLKASEARQRGRDLLRRVDLLENADHKISELSKGMQQKVQFIATIIHRPRLVIVDEPFSGLDPVNTEIIKDLITHIKSEGGAIMMSTHEMHMVEEIGDRLMMMSKGSRVLYGEVNEVRQRFAQNAVLVEGEGDWQALQGVDSVENGRNGRGILLHLKEGVQPDHVMQAIATSPHYRIRRFEMAVPRLNEIFIEVSGGISADDTISNIAPITEKSKPKRRFLR